MSKNWWYVEGSERKGPVAEDALRDLLNSETLNSDSYIWTKGFENWIKLYEVDELSHFLNTVEDEAPEFETSSAPEMVEKKSEIDLTSIGKNERVFYIKTGSDRNSSGSGAEYGPFSLEQLAKLFEENRINDKTYIFTTGMDNWSLLASFKLFSEISGGQVATIEDEERREHIRKPFVANMYFHDQSELYKGVCRDISIGGMQVLVSNFPGEIDDEVTMNVHPTNSDYCFVASGRIVRILDGNSGFSLRFDGIEEDAKSAIVSYLEK